MKKKTKILQYLVKNIISKHTDAFLPEEVFKSEIDWAKLNYALNYNELSPFLYPLIKNLPISIANGHIISLKKIHYAALAKYLFLQKEFLRVINAAKKSGVIIVPIKGLALAELYYQQFGFRPIVDIDLLVREEQIDTAIDILLALGYEKVLRQGNETYWRNTHCHLEFSHHDNPQLIIELHWALDFKRFKKTVLPGLWNRLKKMHIDGETIHVLSPEDRLLCLALHQRRFGKMFNLKYVCDVGMTLEKETIDWDYLIHISFEEKARASLYFLLYQAQYVLDKDLQGILNRLKLPLWHRGLIIKITRKYIYNPPADRKIYFLYLKCHFLMYDDIMYPINFIINIPLEQFAKFYSLPLYSKKTYRLYKIRFIYGAYRMLNDFLRQIFKFALHNQRFPLVSGKSKSELC